LPAAITVEPVDEYTCVVDVGSDSAHLLALYLGILDADFHLDGTAAADLAGYLRTLSARYARAVS
jgi:hypothetical protein